MAKLLYGSCQSDGIRIQYYRTGDDKPPVVLLHGFSDNGLCWSRLGLYLEPDYDVVMIDARAHGMSDAPASGYSYRQQAADVAAVIQQLQLRKPVLVGHSMGANTAAVTAGLYPQLVAAVALEDPPWRDAPALDEQHLQQRLEETRARLLKMRSQALEELIEEGEREHPSWDQSEWFQWAKAKKQVKPEAAGVIVEGQIGWRQVAQSIVCPVLLLTGDPQLGAVVTPEIAQEAAAMWRKKGVHVNAPGAGHNIRRERFDLFLNAVTHFIAKS